MFGCLKWLLIVAALLGVGCYFLWKGFSPEDRHEVKRSLIDSIEQGHMEPFKSVFKEKAGEQLHEKKKELLRKMIDEEH